MSMTARRLQRPAPVDRKQLPRYDLPAEAEYILKPIGVVRSPYRMREDAPRQATVGEAIEAVIVLRPGLQNALQDLEGFDRLWVVAWFHHSRGWKQQIMPPRDQQKRGLFATRAPDRPNAVGLSAVQLVSIFGTRITVRGCDLLDGTPVLDLKPYIPAYDAFPTAAAGWVDQLAEPGPDHRTRDVPHPPRTPRS
jgi:tRNA (adenine37-N6)-methyltransferase